MTSNKVEHKKGHNVFVPIFLALPRGVVCFVPTDFYNSKTTQIKLLTLAVKEF